MQTATLTRKTTRKTVAKVKAATQKPEDQMEKVHAIIKAAVGRSMVRGVSEREAFGRHMTALAAMWPKVAAAYTRWLMKS